jgi:xylose isomerase
MSAAQKTANGRSSFKIKMLEEKVKKFDYGFQRKCVEERDYEALEMYVIELLLEG